jgi:hypothetical protein
MKLVNLAISSAFLATIVAAPQAAWADHISLQSKDKVEGACNEKGGVYWPSSAGGTYGCMNKDGSGIVCGGTSAEDKKSCDTWPASARIAPTRSQVRAWVRTHPTQTTATAPVR